MAKVFHPGQKVRVVKTDEYSNNAGIEKGDIGTVVDTSGDPSGLTPDIHNPYVKFDKYLPRGGGIDVIRKEGDPYYNTVWLFGFELEVVEDATVVPQDYAGSKE